MDLQSLQRYNAITELPDKERDIRLMARKLTILTTTIFLTLHALLGPSVHHGHAFECPHEVPHAPAAETDGSAHEHCGHGHESGIPDTPQPAEKHAPCPEESCCHELEFSFTTGQRGEFVLALTTVAWLSWMIPATPADEVSTAPERVDRVDSNPLLERQSLRALSQVWRL